MSTSRFSIPFAHVLFVEPARELEEVVGVAGIHGVRIEVALRERGLLGSRSGHRHRGRCGRLTGTTLPHFRPSAKSAPTSRCRKLFVLLIETTQLDDDLVEEVIDLVLVVAFTELGRVEPLVDHVFRSQRH